MAVARIGPVLPETDLRNLQTAGACSTTIPLRSLSVGEDVSSLCVPSFFSCARTLNIYKLAHYGFLTSVGCGGAAELDAAGAGKAGPLAIRAGIGVPVAGVAIGVAARAAVVLGPV